MLVYRTDQTLARYFFANNRYFGSGQFVVYPACDYWPCPTAGQSVNFASWMALTGLDRGSSFTPGAPTGVWTSVRPNTFEPGRANIVIYNWDLKPSVPVDLSDSGIQVGDHLPDPRRRELVQRPRRVGTYSGAPVTSIPMTGLTVVQPFGVVPYPPSHTAPQFGVFVLLSATRNNALLERSGVGRAKGRVAESGPAFFI